MSQNPFTRLLRFLFFAVVVRAVMAAAIRDDEAIQPAKWHVHPMLAPG